MSGERPEATKPTQPEAEAPSLFSHAFMDKIKHGASVVKDTTVGIVKSGVEKGEHLTQSSTVQKATEDLAEARKHVFQTGRDVVNSPTTHRIAGQVIAGGKDAGKEVIKDNVRNFGGLVEAARHGDASGAFKHGAPIAAEVVMGPSALAALKAKEVGSKILIDNLPPEQRENAKKLKAITGITNTSPSHIIPNLIIDGASNSKR